MRMHGRRVRGGRGQRRESRIERARPDAINERDFGSKLATNPWRHQVWRTPYGLDRTPHGRGQQRPGAGPAKHADAVRIRMMAVRPQLPEPRDDMPAANEVH